MPGTPSPSSQETINATAIATVISVGLVPIYHKLIKPKFNKVIPDTKKDDDATAPRRGRLSRRPSVLEELTSVPLVLRVLLWLQTFQGLVMWLAPSMIAELYGVVDIPPLPAMLCEDLGRTWLAVHFSALIGGRKGTSTSSIITAGLSLLLISELKAFLNDDYLGGYTPNRVIILIAVKLVSMWGLEYGPEIKQQEGTLAETAAKIIPSQELIGYFAGFYVLLDGGCMYFAPYKYAEFWGYTLDSELARFLAVSNGEILMMLGTFWLALLRDVDNWKAYGLAACVYWGCTIDFGFISQTIWFVGETGMWTDLTLSYLAIITAAPWEVFM